ncbi:MAG: cytochrome c oxidase assembly protein [Betaproteobacteria bacterium RBG_16_66_20]|nr:MAG: cytochrome c oxidase assembly protein [Betaproteobacteria bacterium RBG_16_66_20]
MANELLAGRRERDNRRLFTRLSVVAVAMFGFGFALVPFYDQICRALGINSLVERGEIAANSQVDRTRLVSIEFDANAHGMPWRFQPAVRHMEVHPGELVQVEYEVANVRGAPVTGQAVVSYGPALAGRYFRKLECFCFTQQTLAAGESRRMPVSFVVDASLPGDINTITLSYTFFEVAGLGGKS